MAERDEERFDEFVRDLLSRARSDAPIAAEPTQLQRRNATGHRSARWIAVAVAAAAIATVVIAARSGDAAVQQITPIDSISAQPTTAYSADSIDPAPTSVPAGSVTEFCDASAVVDGDRPESYVGSPQQAADIEALIDVAPAEIRGELTVVRDYVTSGSITAADPESNVIANWPQAVQAATVAIDSYRGANCSGSPAASTDAASPAVTATTSTTSTTSTASIPTTEPLVLTPNGVDGASLDDGALTGRPAVLSALPPGYQINYFKEGVTTAGSDEVSWYATLLHVPDNPNAGEITPYVSVAIGPASGDLYRGFADAGDVPETQVGAFTGKWLTIGPDSPAFVAAAGDGYRMTISGRTTHDVIAAVVAGATVRDDPASGVDLTVPAGYELVDESPGSGPQASQMYGVIYTDDGSMQHEIRIDTLIDPAQPAITRLTFPEAARVYTIGRWTGYAAAGSLTIDITPGYQVMISLGIGPNAGPTNDERLLQLARALVSVDDAARGALMTQAALHPLMAGTYDACDPTTQSGCPITPSTLSTIDGS